MSYFDWQNCYSGLFEHLERQNHGAWVAQIRQQLTQRFDETPHGDVPRWQSALELLTATAERTAQTGCARRDPARRPNLVPGTICRSGNGITRLNALAQRPV